MTVEANPETVGPAELEQLRAGGVTRVSFGMQSSVPHVLRVLDREHQPGRPLDCVRWARAAGFEQVSLDLIYGTPGESDDDWRRSLTAAIEAGPDHVSAYALIVEDGTRLAAKVRRGEIAAPDDDAMADRYLIADDLLTAAGLAWYELSNWAKSDKSHCRHNLLYWTGGDWWGFGPGAHSHVGGVRWWNVQHPTAYAQRLAAGRSPAAARERLTAAERRMEEIMLRARLAEGLPLSLLTPAALAEFGELAVDSALIDRAAHADGRLVLTLRGPPPSRRGHPRPHVALLEEPHPTCHPPSQRARPCHRTEEGGSEATNRRGRGQGLQAPGGEGGSTVTKSMSSSTRPSSSGSRSA